MYLVALFVFLALTTAQNIQWTGQEGGWVELVNTDFESIQSSTWFKSSSGKINRIICGSEGVTISPSPSRGTLTWQMQAVPTFTEIYVKIRFAFIDDWKGEEGYITVNGIEIWRKKSTKDQGTHNVRVCGRTQVTDEIVTVERRVRITGSSNAVTVVMGANTAQVDQAFFAISGFVVYILAGNGSPAPTGGEVVQGTWNTLYQSNFVNGAPSDWVDKAGNPVVSMTCGVEGAVIRQGKDNYLQWSGTPAGQFKRVRVSLRFGFLDSWDGETATITVNNKEIWKMASKAATTDADLSSSSHTTEVCGDGSRPPRSLDRFVNVLSEIEIPPPADGRVTVRVTSDLDQDINNESYVIENVKIEVLVPN